MVGLLADCFRLRKHRPCVHYSGSPGVCLRGRGQVFRVYVRYIRYIIVYFAEALVEADLQKF